MDAFERSDRGGSRGTRWYAARPDEVGITLPFNVARRLRALEAGYKALWAKATEQERVEIRPHQLAFVELQRGLLSSSWAAWLESGELGAAEQTFARLRSALPAERRQYVPALVTPPAGYVDRALQVAEQTSSTAGVVIALAAIAFMVFKKGAR